MIGHKIIFKDSLDSTNNYVAKLMQQGNLASGTVIMAGHQTSGRGQRGSVWEDEPFKNLIFSCFVQYDNLSVQHQSSISQWVSLALCRALMDFGVPAQVKWPNDLVVEHRKIAGILIENQLKQDQVVSSILGVGLNVNQTEFNLTNITSMSRETGREFSVEEVAFQLIHHLNDLALFLSSRRFYDLKNMYLDRLWLYDVWSEYHEPGGAPFDGKLIDVNDLGQLILLTRNNEVKTYSMKEIAFTWRSKPAI